MNDAQRELRDVLVLIRDFRRQHNFADLREKGYEYSCAEDFVLQHGEWFDPTPLPDAYEFGPEKMCYWTSMGLAEQFDNLTYVEGFGYWRGAGFAIPHAWCVDDAGRLIDATWRREEGEYAYLGVRFSLNRAIEADQHGGSVLDDWPRKWPIFKAPWQGEIELVGS